MDRTETPKRYQSSNIEQLEVNAKLFTVMRKRNISTKERLKKIKELLERDPQPDINAQDGNDNWNTALHLTIERNELEVVNLLLSEGANTSIKNGIGKTPLQLAEECNLVEIIDALKSCVSQVELPPSQTGRLASQNSQPVAADPNQVSVIHSNSHTAATAKQTVPTVLPPFLGGVNADKELNLSHDDFKRPIEKFYANKQLSAIDQLKTTPPYPTPHVLAQFANMADCKDGKPEPPDGWQLLTTASNFGIKNGYYGTAYWHPEHQHVVIAHKGTDITTVGALVYNVKSVLFNNYVQQMSSASTFANKVVTVLQEIEQERNVSFELFFTGHSSGGWLAQITSFTTEYLEVKGGTFLKKLYKQPGEQQARSTEQDTRGVKDVSFTQDTAFSLQYIKDTAGTFLKETKTKKAHQNANFIVQEYNDRQTFGLAQVVPMIFQYVKNSAGSFFKKEKERVLEKNASTTVQLNHNTKHSYHPHTVVFDSLGCENMLSEMTRTFDVRLHGSSIDLDYLDITSYLSAPNLINTCNSHLGTVYRIFIDLSDMDWKVKHTELYNPATHSMDKIVKVFDPETGQVTKDDKGRPKIREVIDWPVSAGLTGGAELNYFFKWAEHLINYHPDVMDISHSKVPNGYHCLRYQTKHYKECTNSLSIFTQDEREFLECYIWLRHMQEFFPPEDLFSAMNNTEAAKEAEQMLKNFQLGNDIVRCPDASTLRALIPYVKRLVRHFPHIKEKMKAKILTPQIRNKVYQHETQFYVESIQQSKLEFNPSALGLREFLEGDQQIWQLRMMDADAWTGITKVYRILQNTSCTLSYSSEGHYTIIKLQRLLAVNRMINLNALLTSMETPHLLMIACGTNQPVNDELTGMFKGLFSILEQKRAMKLILTVQSEDDTDPFVQQIGIESHREGFITTDEYLTWSDLTTSAQTEILKKTVIFQGNTIALNQLTSAESMTDSFPLTDLLQETELRIGKEPVSFGHSDYTGNYYIDRTFIHNSVIRQEILRNKRQGKFADILATTEQEFKQLCQQNPKSNVHWLGNEKSGELTWLQSQGDLKTLRKHINVHKTHSYATSDLDKLLHQAKHHRVMLISATAGMGKTTVLTHLSKQIKQNSPATWLVRIDLNEYTELLKAQKGKMDKASVLEFVSREVLKLESDLEKQLFEKNFEGNEISKVVVMVDGFDEVCPDYRETVIDLLQVLKQTSIEQLWVTTRPHLREELEDNLQQLSYTLKRFSEDEQVEFLTKFWLQNLYLEDKDKHLLPTYAEGLIRKFVDSIRDKDKKFTGIPLQIRMIAEAFEEDFISFYESEKSEPEFPHKIDLLQLYKRFIDRKYNIYYAEKSKIPAGDMAAEWVRERHFQYIQVEHRRLALEALFNEDQVSFLKVDDGSRFSDDELARVGIAQRNVEGKPQFIHRAFAEYFVAEFLIQQLTKSTKQNKQVLEILLNEVLVKRNSTVIRAFLDGLLKKLKPSKEVLEEVGKKLNEYSNERKQHQTRTLHVAEIEDNARIVGFLLDSLESGKHSKV